MRYRQAVRPRPAHGKGRVQQEDNKEEDLHISTMDFHHELISCLLRRGDTMGECLSTTAYSLVFDRYGWMAL
jgi:hypothetical protein